MPDAGTLKVTTPTDREIQMSREFDASREKLFQAFTRPDLLRRWLLGPPGWGMEHCEVDLRVGGNYRYVWRNAQGETMGMTGTFREISTPAHLVATEKFDRPWDHGEAVGTVVFTEESGRTTVTQTVLYLSRKARDGVLRSGMEQGVAASYDRLAELLASGA